MEKFFKYYFWGIFAGLGTLFVVVGVIMAINVFNYENAIDTTGVITEITRYRDSDGDSSYDVYVSYYVDDEKYNSVLNSYSSSFYEGKEINIYYDKTNPRKIGVKSLDLLVLIFPGIGSIFAIIGYLGVFVNVSKKRNEIKLKEFGELVYADYVETEYNTYYSINGRHPYNIICKWTNPEDDVEYKFKSKNLWFDPEVLIEDRNITKFPVYIKSENPKKYVIDVESTLDLENN